MPSVSQLTPIIGSLPGELPIMVNAPIVRSSIVGAIRVIVKSPAVRMLILALLPDGPANVYDVPPGAIETSALPRSVLFTKIESSEFTDEDA